VNLLCVKPLKTPLWHFADSMDHQRVQRLMEPATFESVVEDVLKSGTITTLGDMWEAHRKVPGVGRAKISIRASPLALDRFFNSPFGYRAEYARSVERGQIANRIVLDWIVAHRSLHSGLDARVLRSLHASQAKVWFRQKRDKRVHCALNGSLRFAPEVLYPSWVNTREQSVPTPEGDRWLSLAGTLAFSPLEILEIMGGWLYDDGSEWIDTYKQRRSDQIHAYGFA
jgi:hypothetical protein